MSEDYLKCSQARALRHGLGMFLQLTSIRASQNRELDVDTAQRYRPHRWLLYSRRADVIASLWSSPHINTITDEQTVRKEACMTCQDRLYEAAKTTEAVVSPEPTLRACRSHGSEITGAVFCLQAVKHFRHPHQHLCFHPPQNQHRIQLRSHHHERNGFLSLGLSNNLWWKTGCRAACFLWPCHFFF